MSDSELDLGNQRIKASGGYYYIRIPKVLVESGAIPGDVDYHVIVKPKEKQIDLKEVTEPAE